MTNFKRISRLPPYVFSIVNGLKMDARHRGEDIIDFGMGNPDQVPPQPVIDKLIEASKRTDTHRYSVSKGITRLRKSLCDWYDTKYSVNLDPESEVVVTMGSKEGIAHLALAIVDQGDVVLAPSPTYPIHIYGFIIAGAQVNRYSLEDTDEEFLKNLKHNITKSWPCPKVLVLNFPANPTTRCVELDFLAEIVAIAKHHGVYIIHDLAYAEIAFDGYKPPSILQVKGAKDIAVETYSMSKTYNMPGWRVGFVSGNKDLVHALVKIKSYLDYGMFTPIQVAAITAFEVDNKFIEDNRLLYQERRNCLCEGLNDIGWSIDKPKATMFVWAKIPDYYVHMGSLEFSKKLLKQANIAVSPGIGFGEEGDSHVRFALIENEQRTRQGIKAIKAMFKEDGIA